MAKLSVVVPVYGVELYIEKCVRHLFEQTLDDIEYIIVDDCSPDNSMGILHHVLKEYPNRAAQVKIIKHEQNLGLVYARRTGYKAATGDYVISCDSDDWMDRTMCEKMYNAAVSSGADVVWCDFIMHSGDETDHGRIFRMKEKEDKYAALKSLVVGPKWGNIWSHLVSRNLVNHSSIIWPEWNFGEDLTLTFQYIYYSSKLKYVNEPLYYYRSSNPNSYSNAASKEKLLKNIEGDIQTLLVEIQTVSQDKQFISIAPYSIARLFLKRNGAVKLFENPVEAQKAWTNLCPRYGLLALLQTPLSIQQKILISILCLRIYPLFAFLFPFIKFKF